MPGSNKGSMHKLFGKAETQYKTKQPQNFPLYEYECSALPKGSIEQQLMQQIQSELMQPNQKAPFLGLRPSFIPYHHEFEPCKPPPSGLAEQLQNMQRVMSKTVFDSVDPTPYYETNSHSFFAETDPLDPEEPDKRRANVSSLGKARLSKSP